MRVLGEFCALWPSRGMASVLLLGDRKQGNGRISECIMCEERLIVENGNMEVDVSNLREHINVVDG